MATKQTIINITSIVVFAGVIGLGGHYAMQPAPAPTPAPAPVTFSPAPPSVPKTHQTVDYYVRNPGERQTVLARCNNDVALAQNDPDCLNAAEAYFKIPSQYTK